MHEPKSLVLIIDKSPDTLVLLRNVVEESGIPAITLSPSEMDAEAILTYVARHSPDLILFDIPWPYEKNFSMFCRMRQDPRGQRATWIALSTSDPTVARLKAIGELAVLGKPFILDELMELVGGALTDAHR